MRIAKIERNLTMSRRGIGHGRILTMDQAAVVLRLPSLSMRRAPNPGYELHTPRLSTTIICYE